MGCESTPFSFKNKASLRLPLGGFYLNLITYRHLDTE